jgi:hypothetical protein
MHTLLNQIIAEQHVADLQRAARVTRHAVPSAEAPRRAPIVRLWLRVHRSMPRQLRTAA